MEQYMHWYTDVLKKYAVIQGRTTRQEYWMFILLNFIISILVSIVASIIHLRELSSLYSLVLLIPSITVLIRRLHDTNRSGWWALLILVPIIGWIVLFIFAVQKSYPGPNSYDVNSNTATSQSEKTPELPIEEKTQEDSSEEVVINDIPETKPEEDTSGR